MKTRIQKLNNLLKISQFFDMETARDFPKSMQTMIPEADKEFQEVDTILSTQSILNDSNKAEDFSVVATVKRFFKTNPYGKSYTGIIDSRVDPQLVSIIREFENTIQRRAGKNVVILNGNNINAREFSRGLELLREAPEPVKIEEKPKEQIGVTTVESPGKSEEKDPVVAEFQKILGVEQTGVIDEDTRMAASAIEFKIAEVTGDKGAAGLLFRNDKFNTTPADLKSALELIRKHKKAMMYGKIEKVSRTVDEFTRSI